MMNRKIFFLTIAFLMLSGCVSSGIKDLEIYKSPPPYSGQPKVHFGAPRGELPLFQFRYIKESLHTGLPFANEIQMLKTKGASMGARTLVLDCPGPGVVGSGMCMVYGFE